MLEFCAPRQEVGEVIVMFAMRWQTSEVTWACLQLIKQGRQVITKCLVAISTAKPITGPKRFPAEATGGAVRPGTGSPGWGAAATLI